MKCSLDRDSNAIAARVSVRTVLVDRKLLRNWKSIEFDQNVRKVLKKYASSKFSHLFIQILFFSADNRSADVSCIAFQWAKFSKI